MQQKRFRYVPHTADAAFVARGGSFKAAFESAALALLSLMLDQDKIKGAAGRIKTVRMTDKASSREELVWFVLQDILSKVDERKLNAFGFKINRLSEEGAIFKVNGCIFYKDSGVDSALMSVKAVTPHGLKVRKTGKAYTIRVVVDV